MNTLRLPNIEINLYDRNIPIGLALSGGADSAILAFILMKYSVAPIHFFTLGSQSKNFVSIKHSTRVIQKCIELTNNLNITHHVEYTREQERDPFLKFLTDKVDLGIVQVMYTVTTNTPPAGVMDQFTERISSDILLRRNPKIPKSNFSHNKKLYHPFINLDKQYIKYLYEHFNVLDDLFPLTRSCESLTEFSKHCGSCWWCNERKWAFGRLE
jgi:7-cyano-7-deazaguanine synthase in queuosine biosynthesis